MLLTHPPRLLRSAGEPEERIREVFDLHGQDLALGEERLIEGSRGRRERFVMLEHFLQGDDARSLGRGHLSLSTSRKLLEAEQERADDAENHESFHGSISSCPPWNSKRGATDLSPVQSRSSGRQQPGR